MPFQRVRPWRERPPDLRCPDRQSQRVGMCIHATLRRGVAPNHQSLAGRRLTADPLGGIEATADKGL